MFAMIITAAIGSVFTLKGLWITVFIEPVPVTVAYGVGLLLGVILCLDWYIVLYILFEKDSSDCNSRGLP